MGFAFGIKVLDFGFGVMDLWFGVWGEGLGSKPLPSCPRRPVDCLTPQRRCGCLSRELRS